MTEKERKQSNALLPFCLRMVTQHLNGVLRIVTLSDKDSGFPQKNATFSPWKSKVFNNIPIVLVENVENSILDCGKLGGKGEKLR